MMPDGLVVLDKQQGYARDSRTTYWCELHQRAFDALTGQWKSYGDLKATGLDYLVFEDLWAFGVADRGSAPVFDRDGANRGSVSYFKRTDELDVIPLMA